MLLELSVRFRELGREGLRVRRVPALVLPEAGRIGIDAIVPLRRGRAGGRRRASRCSARGSARGWLISHRSSPLSQRRGTSSSTPLRTFASSAASAERLAGGLLKSTSGWFQAAYRWPPVAFEIGRPASSPASRSDRMVTAWPPDRLGSARGFAPPVLRSSYTRRADGLAGRCRLAGRGHLGLGGDHLGAAGQGGELLLLLFGLGPH